MAYDSGPKSLDEIKGSDECIKLYVAMTNVVWYIRIYIHNYVYQDSQ